MSRRSTVTHNLLQKLPGMIYFAFVLETRFKYMFMIVYISISGDYQKKIWMKKFVAKCWSKRSTCNADAIQHALFVISEWKIWQGGVVKVKVIAVVPLIIMMKKIGSIFSWILFKKFSRNLLKCHTFSRKCLLSSFFLLQTILSQTADENKARYIAEAGNKFMSFYTYPYDAIMAMAAAMNSSIENLAQGILICFMLFYFIKKG